MKNRLAMFLALVLLAQGLSPLTEQVAKVPALLAHFYTHHHHAHHDHGDELTFFDFLAQHYGGHKHHHDGGNEHSKLPFRAADASCTALMLAPPSEQLPLPVISIALAFRQKATYGSGAFHSCLYARDIFRPPLG